MTRTDDWAFRSGFPLAAPELDSATLDGELIRVGDAYLAIDTPATAWSRAAALALSLADDRVIVDARCAAWVWGWIPTRPPLSTCVSIAGRVPSPTRRALNTREVVIAPEEIALLGSVAVTSPIRTVIDILRHADDVEAQVIVSTALTVGDVDQKSVERRLNRCAGSAHIARARQRWRRVLSRC